MIMPNTDSNPSPAPLAPFHALKQWLASPYRLMHRSGKIFIKLIVGLVLFLTTILVSLTLYPPDLMPYTGLLSRFLAEQTGLTVRLQGISLQTGLSLAVVGQGVTISAPDSDAPLFTVNQILLRLSPLSWQRGWLSTSIILQEPALTLRREATGALWLGNRELNTLMKEKKTSPGNLPMTALTLQNASLTWIDLATPDHGIPFQTQVNQLNATGFLEQNGAAHFSVEGWLPQNGHQTKLFAKGERSQSGLWSYRCLAEQLQLTPFVPYLTNIPPLDGLTSPLDLDAIIQQSANSMQIQWQLKAGSGKLALPAVFRWPFAITTFSADGLLTQAGPIWNLDVKQFDFLGDHGQATGKLTLTGIGGKDSPHLDLTATASGTLTDQAKFYYPTRIMYPPLVEWLDNSLKDGHVTKASVRIKGDLAHIPAGPTDPKEDIFHIEGDVTGLSLHYYIPLIPLTNITTHVEFDRYSMTALVPMATLGGTKEVHGEVKINNMVDNPIVEISAESAQVDLNSVWREIVTHPKLRWDQAVGMEGATLSGQGVGSLKIALPLQALSKLSYSGQLEMRQTEFRPTFLSQPLTNASGLLTLNQDQLEIQVAQAGFGDFPLSGQVKAQNYRTLHQTLFFARLNTILSEKSLLNWSDAVLGEEGWIKGSAPMWLEFFRKPGEKGFYLTGKADLQSVDAQGVMGWQKRKGEVGVIKGEGRLSLEGRLNLNPLKIELGNLGVTTQTDWDLSRTLGKMIIPEFHLGKTRGKMWLTHQNASIKGLGEWTGNADLTTFDLSPLWATTPKKEEPVAPLTPESNPPRRNWPRVSLELRAEQVLLANGEEASQLDTKMEMELRSLKIDSWRMQQGAGQMQGSGEFLWSQRIGSGGYSGRMHMTSLDFGKLFRSLDLHEGLQAGNGNLDVTLDGFLPHDKRWLDTLSGTARFKFHAGKIRRFGFLSTLLGIFSLKELPNLVKGERPDLDVSGLHYKEFQGTFAIHDNVWSIDKMTLQSPSMNIIFSGEVDFPKDRINLLVGMRPLQTLDALVNGVPLLGKLVTGDRETMVETQFDVTGSTQKPQVNIRPVSSFVPGLLRDILSVPMDLFKRIKEPVPVLQEEGSLDASGK